MQFDNYHLYSVISAKEKQGKEDSQKILEIIKKIDSLSKGEDVKEYLRNDLQIKNPVKNFPIKGKGVLNYYDYDTTFSVEIILENKHSVFCFSK